MATLMQKDVLIEYVATINAEMFHYSKNHAEDDLFQQHDTVTTEKRSLYYCTAETSLDYEKELAELQRIRARYKKSSTWKNIL